MRALGLAIILTVTGQIPAPSFAADRCSGLFSVSKSSPSLSTLNMQAIAEEWVDLDFQMRATDSSSLQVALKAKRDQILAEIEKHQGPQAALEMRNLIRGRRPKVDVVTKEQTERAAQLEQLKGRPKELSKLQGVRSVGPFLNDHQFLAATWKFGKPHLISVHDLRASSSERVWISARGQKTLPIGVSPKLDFYYFVDEDSFYVYTVKTGAFEETPLSYWGLGKFESAEQSQDRSTIFVTLKNESERSVIKVRLNADGSFKNAEPFATGGRNRTFVTSPDGSLMVSTADGSDVRVFDVAKDITFSLPPLSDQTKAETTAVFSPDSRKLRLMRYVWAKPSGPRSVFTWNIDTNKWESPLVLRGDVPLSSYELIRVPDPQKLIVRGLAVKSSRNERPLYLIDLELGSSQLFQFKDSIDEKLESTFSSADQRTLYAVTSFSQSAGRPKLHKLYEIDLSSLYVSSSPLPKDFSRFGNFVTSPDSSVILRSSEFGSSVDILK